MVLRSATSPFPTTAIFLVLCSTSYASFIIQSLSFGHLQDISPNGLNIPGWSITGEGHEPRLLSDRVVLTPPAPGNRRGALWTDNPLSYPEWDIDIEFRASGPERGSGNLQVWLTKGKPEGLKLASVYTTDQFDGLVLELDQYGGMGGAVRGFLNDGSMSYKTHHNVDGLAFGHCDYAYRNLGRMSRLRVKQDHEGLEVNVDDRPCFKSNQIQLPSGYYFGVSAASAENPDSFEISKFVVSTTTAISREEVRKSPPPPAAAAPANPSQANEPAATLRLPSLPQSASTGAVEAQCLDMLSRLEQIISTINIVHQELKTIEESLEQRHNELKAAMPAQDMFNAMSRRIQNIDGIVERIQADLEGRDYKEHLTGLKDALRDTQESLLSSLPASMSQIVSTSAPRMGLFVFVMIAFQVMLVGVYVVYKKGRANSPKKLL